MRGLLVAALVASGLVLAAPPASACDPAYDPSCQTPCTIFDRYWDQLTRYLVEPPSKPLC